MKFTITGNPHFTMVLITNVAGAGDVVEVQVKGTKTGWMNMQRNWGQIWHTGTVLVDQSLSFKVTDSERRTSLSENVTPPNWQFGQTYVGINF